MSSYNELKKFTFKAIRTPLYRSRTFFSFRITGLSIWYFQLQIFKEFKILVLAVHIESKTYSHMCLTVQIKKNMDRVKWIWYLSPMRAAKVQASLRIHAVSPEPSLLAHTSSESRGTFRQKARSLAPLNGWACAVKVCHDGMLEDTKSLDGAHI